MSKRLSYNVNLLPKDPFLNTSAGRVLQWSLNTGRYIVIFTEIVVILSFASRFVLDRKVTDLNESIYQKQLIISSQDQFENEFRLVQAKIQNLQQLEQQNNLIDIFPIFQKIIPNGLQLEKMNIRQNVISGEALASSNDALTLFISNLQLSPHFQEVSVSKIETSDEKQVGFLIQFSSKYQI